MLHVTNGDSVVMTFADARLAGRYLPWRDVLHDGAVPQTATLDELSDVRARALCGFGWGEYDAIRASFAQRDETLAASLAEDEVVLWFEHDLCDQLQLLQILDWFAGRDLHGTRLSLVQIDAFPGVEPFYGLGQLTAEQLMTLLPLRREVSAEQLASGRAAWRAVCAREPAELIAWTRRDSAGLPYLRAALRRFCEEYPWTSDGLGRHERQILQAVAEGHATKRAIYFATREHEPCPWGDLSVYLRVDGLANAAQPALKRGARERYALTKTGRALLDGSIDWIALGGIDRWIGGVHLCGASAAYRWDTSAQTIVAAA